MYKILLFSLLVIFTSMVYARELSSVENNILADIANEQSSQLSLLEKLVNINSGTTNIAGVRKVGEILRAEFNNLGFKTSWHEEPDYMHRAGTLIAERAGNKGNRILLIGHLDTVFPANHPFKNFIRDGNIARGPGVIDAKGGDVVILYALKALKKAGVLDNASITVVLTGDEENAGKPVSISRKPLYEAAKRNDIAMDFECSIPETGTIGRRGVSHWIIRTTGKEGHSAQVFNSESGNGAIYELSRILNSIRTELSNEKYFSFNPGIILGGTEVKYEKENTSGSVYGKENIVAKNALAVGDFRFLAPEQKNKIEEKIKMIVNKHLPKTTANIIFQDGIPSMPPTADNLALLEKYSEVSMDLGHGKIRALDPGARGAGDISHIASIVKSSLAGLGPACDNAHSEKETLAIPSLKIQTERTALLIYRLIQ